jgi:surface antigen
MNKLFLLISVALSLAVIAAPAPAQPPPHAKAHGWRKMNDPTYVGYTGKKWEKDYGVAEGRCNTAAVGAALVEQDRRIAVILGTVLGHAIGKELDASDRACMGHTLELASARKTVAWTNANTGVSYRLTPTAAFKEGSVPCRRFTTVLTAGKKKDTLKGAACRQADGEWVFKAP